MALFGRRKPGFFTEEEKTVYTVPKPANMGDVLAGYIRMNSHMRMLTSKQSLLMQDVQMPDYLTQMLASPTCCDIEQINGNQDIYYYSQNEMSSFFAWITVLAQEQDKTRMVVEMVRYNGKTYPAVTPIHFFTQTPYSMSTEAIQHCVERILACPDYNDIHCLQSESGTFYLYSDTCFDAKYAVALAEHIENEE